MFFLVLTLLRASVGEENAVVEKTQEESSN